MNFEAATKYACGRVTGNNESSYSGLTVIVEIVDIIGFNIAMMLSDSCNQKIDACS